MHKYFQKGINIFLTEIEMKIIRPYSSLSKFKRSDFPIRKLVAHAHQKIENLKHCSANLHVLFSPDLEFDMVTT